MYKISFAKPTYRFYEAKSKEVDSNFFSQSSHQYTLELNLRFSLVAALQAKDFKIDNCMRRQRLKNFLIFLTVQALPILVHCLDLQTPFQRLNILCYLTNKLKYAHISSFCYQKSYIFSARSPIRLNSCLFVRIFQLKPHPFTFL